MAIIRTKCDCGMPIEISVGDAIYDNKLRWYQSYRCNSCGKTLELDDFGKLPPEIESAIMGQEGSYELVLNDLNDRLKIIHLLKKMQYDNFSAFEQFKEKKSDVIIRGTKNEVLLVKNYLEAKGITNCIVKDG